METNEIIGARIRDLRKRRDMTVEMLGNQIGVDKATITRYERGYVKKISRMNLEGIAKALGVPTNYLVDGVNDDAENSIDKAEYDPEAAAAGEYQMTVTDNQMAPRMKTGDTLYCIQESVPHDKTVAVIRKDNATLIRNIRIIGDTVVLTSDNPAIPVETADIEDFKNGKYEITARVVRMEVNF